MFSRDPGDAYLARVEVAMMLYPWTMWAWVLGTFSFYDHREKMKRALAVWLVEAKTRATEVQMLAAVTVPGA